MKHTTLFIVLLFLYVGIRVNAQAVKDCSVTSFNEVIFEGSARWVLIPSSEEKVVIESKSEDVFDYIDIKQSAGELTINTTDKQKNITQLFKSVTIKVYFKSLQSVSLSGTGSVITDNTIEANKLTLKLSGSGNMDLDVKCSQFEGHMYGTGELEVSGDADKAVVKVDGVGGFDGYELITKNMDVTVSGVGGAKVNATKTLTATLNGVGSIRYKGDPETKNFDTNGVGAIKKAKD
ncbi:MAG: hypothetical protein C0591_03050 [Marinilabiliales bacterium]|nr:MAG: hypothetical protein C0591_03050 [Marinilabiliales bacterium]